MLFDEEKKVLQSFRLVGGFEAAAWRANGFLKHIDGKTIKLQSVMASAISLSRNTN